MAVGGVAVFPSDTVYGLACDPGNRGAVERLYALKRRALDKPSAVMFFDRELALAALPELGPATVAALERLLPGPVTVLLPNPAGRFPLACGGDPRTLGLRVVEVPALAGVRWPVLQSSANLAGGPDPRSAGRRPGGDSPPRRHRDRRRRAAGHPVDGRRPALDTSRPESGRSCAGAASPRRPCAMRSPASTTSTRVRTRR